MALTRKNRLSDKSEFREIFKEGGIINSRSFRIKFLPNQFNLSKFGVVISSKTLKKAVLRNKLRRRISEIIRLNISKIKAGYNIIVFVQSKALNQKIADLKEELFKDLSKIN